ncbi:MAG TPA: sigma 54-interacting transcriptional regulator [Pseudoflavonifractor sp.]|nr:sigma 54-interacting transcriptional regulator [Pseudoflavonifractor sp.]
MKKIAIISNIPLTADNHKAVLERIFPTAAIDVVTVSDAHGDQINADVAVVTAMDIVPYAQKYLSPGAVIIKSAYTLKKCQLEEIRRLERTGPITVVHESPRAAMTRKTLLQRMGIPPDRLHVWYSGLGEDALIGQIIRFGDVELPGGFSPALHIQGRMFNVTSIFEIALGLGVNDITSVPAFTSYCEEVCTRFTPSIDDLSISEFNTMVGDGVVQRGLVAFTQNFVIFYCDSYVASLVGRPSRELIGRALFDVFPFLRSCEIHRGNETQEQLAVHDGKTYAVKLNLVLQTGRETGYLQISDYWAEEQRQGNLRRQVTSRKSKAKYTFGDIIGSSPKMAECKKIAQRMSYSNSSVLITGDTGVGKELFAQSIHSASDRKHQPFIAVNCGAIVESLLESELFGYEKGAFTGANKNGKQGLFELAHKGTLFLDEIGEMPLHLQVRLLRVLQEKEVVRVGGDTVIPVDVRVIAATNKDILQMIRRREFRSDLFYRLNVLPLYIPPLSDRREDILPLISYFKQELGVSFELSAEAENRILSYPFPGNVRELHNCVEYISNLGLAQIGAADLPPAFQKGRGLSSDTDTAALTPEFLLSRLEHACTAPELPKHLRILEAVSAINVTGIGAGRRSIRSYLAHQGLFFSEVFIRNALLRLADSSLVDIERGRGGVRLSEHGKFLLGELHGSI